MDTRRELRIIFALCVLAAKNIRATPLRNISTGSAVLLAACAFMGVFMFGQGTVARVQVQLDRVGANLLFVKTMPAVKPGMLLTTSTTNQVVSADVAILKSELDLKHVSSFSAASKRVVRGNVSQTADIYGVDIDFLEVMEPGQPDRPLSEDLGTLGDAAVGIIGSEIARNLGISSYDLPVVIRVAGVPVNIVRILEPRGQKGSINFDTTVLMPLKAFLQRIDRIKDYEPDFTASLVVRVDDDDPVEKIKSEITRYFESKDRSATIQVVDASDIRKAAGEISSAHWAFNLGVMVIVAFTAVVTMSNMLLSKVIERQREIGLDRALGARRWHIAFLFSAEALILYFCFAVPGIAIGAWVMTFMGGKLNLPISLQVQDAIYITGIGLALALAAAWLPAWQATKVLPLQAISGR